MTSAPDDSARSAFLADPALRSAIERFVRSRVPESDVDDVVQQTLTDAIASTRAPEDEDELRRWVHGIARHKIADLFRKRGREPMPDSSAGDEVPAESAPHDAADLLRWAEKELPDADHADSTLEWMLREGGGEKLEHIAREQDVPAPRVRQRIARMRKHFRERWAAQVAAVAVLVLLIGAGYWIVTRSTRTPEIAREEAPRPTPEDKAREIRHAALEDCAEERWQKCLDGLDRAKELDPVGDTAEAIGEARRAAAEALAPTPAPSDTAPAPLNTAPAPPDTAPKKEQAPKKEPTKSKPRRAPQNIDSDSVPQQEAPMRKKGGKAAPKLKGNKKSEPFGFESEIKK